MSPRTVHCYWTSDVCQPRPPQGGATIDTTTAAAVGTQLAFLCSCSKVASFASRNTSDIPWERPANHILVTDNEADATFPVWIVKNLFWVFHHCPRSTPELAQLHPPDAQFGCPAPGETWPPNRQLPQMAGRPKQPIVVDQDRGSKW